MNAYEVKIEWDEDGCYMVLCHEESHGLLTGSIPFIQRFRLADPEQAYDAVKAGILPWLMERDEAKREYDQFTHSGTGPAAEYFACKDPERDWIRDVALGAMGVGESLEAAAAALDSIDLSRKMERER